MRNQHDTTTLIEQSQPAPVYGAGWTTSSDWFMPRIRPTAHRPETAPIARAATLAVG